MTPAIPAAIYARVSTGEQSTEQQVSALRDAAVRLRLDPVLVEEETGSGAKADRPGLLRVMDAARLGEVRAVLVWKLDRLGRSVLDLTRNVDELRNRPTTDVWRS
jgi:putative DNA-invertase from lambdoid prophage Rac